MASLAISDLVDLDQRSLYISAFSIMFNPLFWNIVARQEYRTRILTRIFAGNSRAACYFLAATIFSLGLVRDYVYKSALADQPAHPALDTPAVKLVSYALFAAGNTLVLSSTWALGITGTFLGDYCGILMDEMVTGFPFNITDAPMYYGSTMSFLAVALYFAKPAGLLLTAWVLVVYLIALSYENPFTSGIYAEREKERAATKKRSKKAQ
ncbi:probable OPI3 - methylene-fatty-acyl-phospholipid synthase [Cephalotrichum gorgonifer]|uniref:Phosphatidyl-N-methylethanolamine N-methyltransferase n=1 Tax=Cephalotrichum gorgonifer TaxID=2041049 RepID=A0AAE8N4N4_9PEZI|nr:probable OPI3 - methylene-fatty-acyl-phospholipid synthase [Cephalotrichum gorgonifer]